MSKLADAYKEMKTAETWQGQDETDEEIVDRGLMWFQSFDVDPGELFTLIDESITELILAAIAEGKPLMAPTALAEVWFKVGLLYGLDRGHQQLERD